MGTKKAQKRNGEGKATAFLTWEVENGETKTADLPIPSNVKRIKRIRNIKI